MCLFLKLSKSSSSGNQLVKNYCKPCRSHCKPVTYCCSACNGRGLQVCKEIQ